jgi:dsRNA-gated channel SID-1
MNFTGRTIPSMWDPSNYKKCHILSMMRKLRTGPQDDRALTILPDGKAPSTDSSTVQGESSSDAPVTTRVDITNIDLIETVYESVGPNDGTLLRMADINKISSKKLTRTATEYSCTLMTIFLFYSLPVLQLVMTHQGLLLVTGNQDICFYNFSCANRVGVLSDFNHIISNAGYVFLGILFLLMVRRRAAFTAKLRQKVTQIDDYGIPSQIGLFYAMGLALVMEGVMSACYHVCPSYNNFQFDTSFMYLIAGLVILKLYHSRHPDVLPKSYAAYMIFAGFILVSLVGVISKDLIYWIIFSTIHGTLTLVIGLQLLFVGYLEFSFGTVPCILQFQTSGRTENRSNQI